MGMISSKAVISPKAELGNNITVRDFAIIEDDVVIGDDTIIDYNALIKSGARIGRNCKIYKGAVISSDPHDISFNGDPTVCEIGDNTVVREYTTISRGTEKKYKTVIGSDCYIMTYCHIAHDDIIGNNVILINSVEIGGHVTIEDWVYVSAFVGIHQFVKIGCHSLISYVTKVAQDVPPYIIADGNPLRFRGINTVGLKRREFSKHTIENIKKAYNVIYGSKYNVSDALQMLKDKMEQSDEVKKIIDFIETSERGIVRKRM